MARVAASQPGPSAQQQPRLTATVLAANVTRWSASWRGLLAAGAEARRAQEARIPAAGTEAAQVGAFGRHPGRLQHFAMHFGGARAVHVMNCYGYAGGRPDSERNADLILEGLEWLRGLGGVPAFMVGDFNCSLSEVGLDALLGLAGWRDLLAALGPTCAPSSGSPSRIDYVLASPAALDMVRSAPALARLRQPVLALDGPAGEGWSPATARDATAAVPGRFERDFRRALAEHNLDEAWQQLDGAMRLWLARRMGLAVTPARPHAASAMRAERPPTSGGGGEAAEAAADAALLRPRRLRNLRMTLGRTTVSARQASAATIQALRSADAACPDWAPAMAALQLGALVSEAMAVRAEAEWHRRVADSLEDRQGRLYRWIRGGGNMGAELVPAGGSGGEAPGSRPRLLALQGGPAARLRRYEGPRKAIWQAPPAPPVAEEWLQELDGPPPFPDRTPWTAGMVGWLLRRMSKRKKPGLDAWAVGELRLLPAELHGWIADLFEEVEARGERPRELAEAEGLLLPKP
ncbi:unnamed protein product, partial [Prorocentrum cordatum]